MSALVLAIYVLVFIGLIYLLTVRPQQRRKRQLEATISALQPGQEVVTMAGIYGTITEVEEGDTVLLEVAEEVDIRIAKASIARVVTPTGADDVATTG